MEHFFCFVCAFVHRKSSKDKKENEPTEDAKPKEKTKPVDDKKETEKHEVKVEGSSTQKEQSNDKEHELEKRRKKEGDTSSRSKDVRFGFYFITWYSKLYFTRIKIYFYSIYKSLGLNKFYTELLHVL